MAPAVRSSRRCDTPDTLSTGTGRAGRRELLSRATGGSCSGEGAPQRPQPVVLTCHISEDHGRVETLTSPAQKLVATRRSGRNCARRHGHRAGRHGRSRLSRSASRASRSSSCVWPYGAAAQLVLFRPGGSVAEQDEVWRRGPHDRHGASTSSHRHGSSGRQRTLAHGVPPRTSSTARPSDAAGDVLSKGDTRAPARVLKQASA